MLGVRNNGSNYLSKDLPKGRHSNEMWRKGVLIVGTLIMIAGLISVSVAYDYDDYGDLEDDSFYGYDEYDGYEDYEDYEEYEEYEEYE